MSSLPAGWVIRVDDAGSSSDTLQPDRLPHQQHFLVGSLGVNRGASGGAGHRTAVAAALVVQVGSTMIMSPGLAASIAAWIEPEAGT